MAPHIFVNNAGSSYVAIALSKPPLLLARHQLRATTSYRVSARHLLRATTGFRTTAIHFPKPTATAVLAVAASGRGH